MDSTAWPLGAATVPAGGGVGNHMIPDGSRMAAAVPVPSSQICTTNHVGMNQCTETNRKGFSAHADRGTST